MDSIPIFKAESDIADQISNCSIAYVSKVEPSNETFKSLAASQDLVSLAAKSDPDLYHTMSVLVSTNWNKNDDIFDKEEVWLAKETPEHKQTNINHNDDKIVGHIVGNWAVDENYKLLPPDSLVDSLPNFHIITASVIYRQRQNPETKAEVDSLIAAIEDGKKFVSMECIFRGFDYAIVTPEGENRILPRTAESAFLTKHLKAYGGTGEYDGHRIGRLLRRITFSGKGFVDKPANPDSIIFDSNPLSFSSGGVLLLGNLTSQDEVDMADTKVLEDQIAELKTSLAGLRSENKDLQDKLAKADIQKYENTISELKAEKERLETDLSTSKEELKTSAEKLVEVEKSLKEVTKAKDTLEADLTKIKAQAKMSERISTLVDSGVSKDIAESKVKLYEYLNDEQFEALSEDIIKANKKVEESTKSTKSDKSDDDDASANDDSKVLDDVQSSDEPDLVVADHDDKLESTRASLVEWVSTKVLKQSGEVK